MKSPVAYVAISLLASSDPISCFSPGSVIGETRSSSSSTPTALFAAQLPTQPSATTTTAANGRRQFLLNGSLSTATSTFLLALSSSLAIAPIPAFADDVVVVAPPSPPSPMATPSYVSSIGDSATALSQSLGHAISVIDALNAQASRLSSSSSSSSTAHNVAVLDGMTAQSRRLVRDLDHCAHVLESIIKDDGYDITSGYPNDKLQIVAKNVSHASSVLDGLVVQGRRLERAIVDVVTTTASSSAGGGGEGHRR